MSEKLTNTIETSSEALDLSVESKSNLDRIKKEALETTSHQAEVAEIVKEVEQKAISAKEVTVGEKEESKQLTFSAHNAMKTDTYKRSLQHIRGRLSGPDRVASKIMHQPAIDMVSNVLSKTVARPSGLLGAGIVALAGSSTLLYLAKHYGFTYNFFVFFLLLAVGYVAGLLLELLSVVLRRIKR